MWELLETQWKELYNGNLQSKLMGEYGKRMLGKMLKEAASEKKLIQGNDCCNNADERKILKFV